MKKIIHLIPYNGIGGVESAANTMKDIISNDFEFQLLYIFETQPKKKNYLNYLNFYRLFLCLSKLLSHKPDLLVVSLWRSCILGIMFKIIKPKTKVVLFLHYPKHYHFVDMIFTKLMSFLCDYVWADSNDTLNSRLPNFSKKNSYIISFVARRFHTSNENLVKPNFIFWGRLHEQKYVQRAIEIFSVVHSHYENAKFKIIGPDGGEMSDLKNLVESKNLSKSIVFLGPQDMESIINLSKDASFYLQTSRLEGMAMSVVEAMQLGLVPVVTPVGEIKNYCGDLKNSLLITDDKSVITNLISLIEDNISYNQMRDNAIKKWENYEIYSEAFINTSKKILGLNT